MMNEYSSIALQNDSPSNHKSSGRCSVHLTLNLSDSSDCYETHKTTVANFSSSPYTMSLWEREEEGNLLKILLNMPERKFSTHSKACTEQFWFTCQDMASQCNSLVLTRLRGKRKSRNDINTIFLLILLPPPAVNFIPHDDDDDDDARTQEY